ncbi:PIN domain-containing protein [Streptomyces sp. CL7]|uniref:PIN domain-containing protein n=1 Tax=Streptomyces sp. CL7 TaxID=3096006 RepID=UPI002A74F5BF|nr:PIN domain-containing protein [Streptomyces sp. CL7]WPP32276.1 PIN domain-containing protein [Streptomyces sp. CL7]
MIILDSCILRTFNPESSSGDLLRAIRAIGAQRVAVPWMVMEELAAQQAIKYREKYEAAAQAVESLRAATPWGIGGALGQLDLDRFRDHWREQWGTVVETISTSGEALREAAFREANCLPPCKIVKGSKTGSRDAAIWLSAVEYAREHPDETVYFASSNTKDFGDGSDYPPLLKEDLAGLEDRFVHWTDLDQFVAHFTKPVTTDMDLVADILHAPEVLAQVPAAAQASGYLPPDGSFRCTAAMTPTDNRVVPALNWFTIGALADVIESAQTYRVGEQEWCTAVVRWHLAGYVSNGPLINDIRPSRILGAGCEWTATVLFRPDADDPRLTVLRGSRPWPMSDDDFDDMPLSLYDQTDAEVSISQVLASLPGARHDLPAGSWWRRMIQDDALRRIAEGQQLPHFMPPER